MLKSTPARKKYTTAGCGGCDKYELCDYDKHFAEDKHLDDDEQHLDDHD